MGSCCSSSINMIGEEFLRQVLQGEALTIRTFDYISLLNEVVSKRVEQEIPKKHIKEYLIPEFYDQSKSGSFDIYYESLFDHILNQFAESNNMYVVLFYFYPFIKHDKEKVYENLFSCLRFMTKSNRFEIDRKEVESWLLKYILFCTRGITYCIFSKCPPGDDLYNSLSNLIDQLYNETNAIKFTKKLISILTDDNPVDLITVDMFKKMLNHYDISTIENIRDFMLHNI